MPKEVPWEYDIDITVMRGETTVKEASILERNLKFIMSQIKGAGWTLTEISFQPEAGIDPQKGYTHATIWADVDVTETDVWPLVKKATRALKKWGWDIEKIVIYPQHPS